MEARMRPQLFVLASCLAGLGCSTALPCHTCPSVAGSYAVTWADGGVDASCPGPRVATWVLAQRDPTQVTTTIGEVTLGGTYYDSYDLLLTGSTIGERYRLKALVIPEGTSLDGGIRLEGTFTATKQIGRAHV
jgi:hypothetical protein